MSRKALHGITNFKCVCMISIIIPIYNVRHFIGRGLQYIFCQTYKNFEIILVDDGSTDGSYEECKKWSLKDERISVFHQQNKGTGSARNLGLEKAKGEYVYFFDIDDEISDELLEYNVHIMQQKDVDMIVFGYKNVETTFKSQTIISFTETEISCNVQLRDVYIDEFVMKVNGFPWNKFYKKSFLDNNNLRFENQRIQQDEVFNMLCYRYVQRMYISPEILYTYYIYEKGNTRSRFIPDRFDIYKSVRQHFEQLKSFWKLTDERLDNYLNGRFYNSVMQCVQFNLLHPDCPWTKEQKNQELERIMSDPLTLEAFKYAESHYCSVEQKMYRNACLHRSLCKLNTLNKIFSTLRRAKQIGRAHV